MAKEIIDIFNEDGGRAGVISRVEVHRRGLIHKAPHIWVINNQGQLLIQKRAATKPNSPNKWDTSVAGHVPSGESPEDAAIREAEEELGVKLLKSELVKIGRVMAHSSHKRGEYVDREINDIYLVRKDIRLSEIVIDREEVSEVKFIMPKDLMNDMEKNSEAYVLHDEEYKILFEYLEI